MLEDEMVVEVQVAEAFAGLVAEPRLTQAVLLTLRRELSSGEVTVVITDDQGIQELNRDFMGLDEPTDVLSFPAQEEGGPFVAAPEGGSYLGDVVISYPRAEAQAAEQQHPVGRELELLVVHGVLHLLGYDHATAEEKTEMWAHQDEILAALS